MRPLRPLTSCSFQLFLHAHMQRRRSPSATFSTQKGLDRARWRGSSRSNFDHLYWEVFLPKLLLDDLCGQWHWALADRARRELSSDGSNVSLCRWNESRSFSIRLHPSPSFSILLHPSSSFLILPHPSSSFSIFLHPSPPSPSAAGQGESVERFYGVPGGTLKVFVRSIREGSR